MELDKRAPFLVHTPREPITQRSNIPFVTAYVLGIALAIGAVAGVVFFAAPELFPESTARAQAVVGCQDAVRAQSRFPSAAEFELHNSVSPHKSDPAAVVVVGRVKMLNGFGAMIPHRYACVVKDGTVTKAAATLG